MLVSAHSKAAAAADEVKSKKTASQVVASGPIMAVVSALVMLLLKTSCASASRHVLEDPENIRVPGLHSCPAFKSRAR